MGLNREDRVNAIAQLRYTERQAQFLELVLRHGGVCVPRQYATVAGIANGGEKCTALFEKLVSRRHAVASDCRHNRARVYHVHCRRLYAAIGEPDSRYRRPLTPRQAVERVMLLDAVIATPGLAWLTNESEKRDYLATLNSAGAANGPNDVEATPSPAPRHRFAGRFPIGIESDGRLVLLYVATVPWPDEFRMFVDVYAAFLRTSHEWTVRVAFPSPIDRAYETYSSSSRLLTEALARGQGRIECVVLSYRYRHLSPDADLVHSSAKPVKEGERVGERVPPRSQPVPQPAPPPALSIAEQLEREWYQYVRRP